MRTRQRRDHSVMKNPNGFFRTSSPADWLRSKPSGYRGRIGSRKLSYAEDHVVVTLRIILFLASRDLHHVMR